MSTEIDAIRAEISELRDMVSRIAPRKKGEPRSRRGVFCRLNEKEILAIEAAAAQRGLSCAELMRQCVGNAIGMDIPVKRIVPVQLARRKGSVFRDQRVNPADLDRAKQERAREAAVQAAAAHNAYVAVDAVLADRSSHAQREAQGMLSESRKPSLKR